MTCGSGRPNCRANFKYSLAPSRWPRNTRIWPAKNASQISAKSALMLSASSPKLPSFLSCIRVSLRIAFDQLGEVEVVAGIHAHAFRQAPAHGDLLVLIQQGNLDAIDLGAVLRQHRQTRIHRRVVIFRAPVALQRGIEHLAEP